MSGVAERIDAAAKKDRKNASITVFRADGDAGQGRGRRSRKRNSRRSGSGSGSGKSHKKCTGCGHRRCKCSDSSEDDNDRGHGHGHEHTHNHDDNDNCKACEEDESELDYSSDSESGSSSSSSGSSDESSESDGDSNDSDSDSEHDGHRGRDRSDRKKHGKRHGRGRDGKKKRHKKKLNLAKSLNAIDAVNCRIKHSDKISRKELECQQSATDAAVDAALVRNLKVHRARKEACNAMHSRKPHKAHPARPKQVVEAYNNLIVARREQQHQAMILKARADAITDAARANGQRAEALRKRHLDGKKALLAEMTVVRKATAAHSNSDKLIEAEAQCLADSFKTERRRRRLEHRTREACDGKRSRSCSRDRSCSREPSPCRTGAGVGGDCKYKTPGQAPACATSAGPGTVGGACAVTAAAVTAAQLGHAPGQVPCAPGGPSKAVTISDLSTLMSALQQQLMEYSASRAEQIVAMNKDSLRALTQQVNDIKNSRCC